MTSVPEESPLLVGDKARDRAVRRLQEAYTEGSISHEELDKRLDQVLTAKVNSELAAALASLPAEPPSTTSTIAAPTGLIQRRGAWRVPRNLIVKSAFGKVRLDLSRAVIDHPAVDIKLQLGTGSAKIILPRDATVDVEDLRTGWKALRYKGSRRTSTGAGPTIRISGTIGFGRLTIRHTRR